MNPLHLFYITNIRIMQDITNGRCGWCGTDELYVKYHDQEWGKLVTDDKTLFEFLLVYFIIVIFNNNRKYMYFNLNRIIYFNIFFMVNLLKVKTIRNFINVVKIGIVLFKYWADRSNLFVYRIPVC